MSQLGLFSHLNDVVEQKAGLNQEPEEKDSSTCHLEYIPTCIKCGVKSPDLKSNSGAYHYCEGCADKPYKDDYTDWHIEKGAAITVEGKPIVKPYCLVCQKTENLKWSNNDKSHYCPSCWEAYGG